MAKRWSRLETWLGLMVLGVGAVILGVAGLWIYVSATAVPLHPNRQDVPVAGGQTPKRWAEAADRARELVRTSLVEQNLPGLSVAVGSGDGIVWAEGFGWADLDTKTPVTPETWFRIGTASTVLTSAAIGLLVEQQKLGLDDEIQTYVPEFPKKEWPVTVRQLMGHTAGILNDGGDEGPFYGTHCDRVIEAVPVFAGRDLRFEPGTRFRYSSFGWILLSAAVEAAAGEPFLTFMRKHVLDPLGMHDTVPDSMESVPGRATAYFPRFAADPRYGPDPMRPVDVSCYAGASVYLSTPSDLVRFGLAMTGGTLLQPSTVELFQTSLRLPSGEETGYGLGWDIETVTLNGQPVRAVGHDGTLLGGMTASLVLFRDRGLVVAAIANTSYADTAGIAVRVAEAFAR